jgi:predicted nucleotidyltransferase
MYQKGSATVEVIVASLVAIPLFIVVPLLGKQIDAKHKTQMAARYAAWERTVWSDAGSTWRNDERFKSDADIALEINDRYFGHRSAELVDVSRTRSEGITTEDMWRDRTGRSLLGNAGSSYPSTAEITEGAPPTGHGFLVSLFAGPGRSSGVFGSLAKRLNLNTGNYAQAHVEMPWRVEFPDDSVLEFPLEANSAILSDAWSPSQESRFHSRVDGMTISDELRVFEAFGLRTFGAFPVYREARYGRSADLVPSTTVVPPEYVP